jgi:septum formation protein
LILASASPRRKALLGGAGLRFEVVESGIDETCRPGELARDYAIRTAGEKALSVSTRIPDALVLAADTVVECDNVIFVKPRDRDEARRMLAALSGRTHTVITAYALASAGTIKHQEPVSSRVTFRTLNDVEIRDYVASGEPMDKAGAYGIQGRSAGFIAQVDGSRDNVMGLPVAEVLAALARHGVNPCEP